MFTLSMMMAGGVLKKTQADPGGEPAPFVWNKLLAVSSASPYLHIYDEDYAFESTLTLPAEPYCIAHDRNSGVVAIGCNGGSLLLYDAEDMSVWPVTPASSSMLEIRGIAFHPTEDIAVVVGDSVSTFIEIYETVGWTKLAAPASPPTDGVWGVSFNHDGSLLATGGFDGIAVFNTSDWSRVTGHANFASQAVVRNMAFSPDSSLLVAAGTFSAKIAIYDTSDWSMPAVSFPEASTSGYGDGIAFSPDSQTVYIGRSVNDRLHKGNTSTWSWVSGTSPAISSGAIQTLGISPDGSELIAGFNIAPYIRRYNASTLVELGSFLTVPNDDVIGVVYV